MRVGSAGLLPRWVVLGGRRVGVESVLREWDEPAAPWEGAGERRYARLLLQSGAVVEVCCEGSRWTVSAIED